MWSQFVGDVSLYEVATPSGDNKCNTENDKE